jgi:hypothetical protein
VAQSESYRPGLVFREDWREIPAEIPVTQEHVNNPRLILNLYGPGKDSVKKSHHDTPADDPYYIWSGITTDSWALTLKLKEGILDLSDHARIVWRSKQSGFRALHVILKQEDGSWLVSRQADGYSGDWRIKEFIIDDLEWYSLDIQTITELNAISEPDLSSISEVGFTDLIKGGGSNACSRLDWIEVYSFTKN